MTTQVPPRTGHPYWMYEMVRGQPAAIARVLKEESDAANTLVKLVEKSERVHVVGIGTSWHAALVGEYLLRVVGGREDARAWNSFEFCAYPPKLGARDAVIVLSHRGTKQYSAQALEMAKAAGASTAIFTGIGSAAKTALADVVVRTSPRDQSAAFTISHTAAMTALAMLAAGLGARAGRPPARELQGALKQLPGHVETALSREAEVRRWVQEAREMQRFYFAGWGPNASTAYEVALKIKETSYVVTEGFQMEQYLHGPFCATQPGCMVTFVAPPGQGRERAMKVMEAANATGAYTAAVVQQGEAELSRLARTTIAMPAVPEALTPIVYLVPLQLFTYWLAVELKHNPDAFRLDDPAHKAARAKYEL